MVTSMAGFISPSVLDQVRSANEIVEVIGAVVPLRRSGANFVALCPFHKEKSPSFSVNPSKQIFYCFGCHKGGDVFRFLQEYESLSFVEAVKRLAERARIPLALEHDADSPQRFLKDTLLTIHEQLTVRWHAALLNDARAQIARDYLIRRGVSEVAIKAFRLGFAPDDWEDTVNWARSKGFDLAVVAQAGLVARKEGDERYYGRFRGRLMFPICDEQGRVIGFSGRVLSGDEKVAKYVNSPETPLFHKGRVIFGLDKAKRALLDRRHAVICEGQLDLIACHMAGVENTVAPQGTALTADHMRVLKRYVNEVILCFDGDKAGINATIRALDDLLKSGLTVRVATLPMPHDPDSFIKEFGPEEFRHTLETAEGFFDFYLRHLCATEDTKQDRGRLAVVRSMRDALGKAGSPVLMDTYAQKTAQKLGVGVDSVRAEFKGASIPSARPGPVESEPPPEREVMARPHPQEFWLLRLLLMDDSLMEIATQRLRLEWIVDGRVREIVMRRFRAFVDGAWNGIPTLLHDLEDAETHRLANEAAADQKDLPNRDQQLLDCIRGMRDRFIDREVAELNRALAEASSAEMLSIQQKQLSLMQLKRSPI